MSKSRDLKDNAVHFITLGAVVAVLLIIGDIFIVMAGSEPFPLQWSINYVPEFLAGTIGVLAGFLLAQSADAKKDEERIPEVKRIIRAELERIRNVADDVNAKYLPSDAWKALVSSGDSGILAVELQEELFKIYAIATELNIQHAREREIKDIWERTKDSDAYKVYTSLAIPDREIGTNLKNMITALFASSLLE